MSTTTGVYSISTCLFTGLSFDQMIEQAGAAGFESLELTEAAYLDEFLQHPGTVRRRLEAAGMRACSVHSPTEDCNCGSADDTERRRSIEAASMCFGPAAEVGAEIIIFHLNAPGEEMTHAEHHEEKARSMDSLAILAQRAQQEGVSVAVENLPKHGRLRVGANPEELLEMIDGLGESMGLCIDTGHSNANGRRVAEDVRIAGEKLLAVHIHDNDGGGDQHRIPGCGTIDWQAFSTAIDQMAFGGPLTFEVGPNDAGIDVVLAGICNVRAAWQSLRKGPWPDRGC